MPSATSTSEIARNANTSGASTKDIEAQLQQLREDIANLAKTVAAVGNDKAIEIKGKARRAANDAADASLQAVEAARAQAETMEQDLERQIRTNPIQSVAIAAGIGFLAALILRR